MHYPSDRERPWVPPRDRATPPMDHSAGWKPSAYDPRIGEVICARIEAGETVRQVTADAHMPAYCTVFQWRKVHPDFDDMYQAMRLRLAEGKIERRLLEEKSRRIWRLHKARVDGRRPRDWRHGPKSTYRRDWAEAFCARIADGESGMSVSADPAMPSTKAVYGWLKRIPEFRVMYVKARAEQQLVLSLEIDQVVDWVSEGAPLADGKREVARIRGRMGRMAPRTWKLLPRDEDTGVGCGGIERGVAAWAMETPRR